MTEICFLKFWSPKKFKTKVLGRFGFCWGFSFWLIDDHFLTVLPHGGESDHASCVASYKGTNPMESGPHS